MFIGHYGVGLALKGKNQCLSLGLLFIAVMFSDLVCYGLALVNVEKFEYVPGFTKNFPYELTYAPYSHGLVAVTVWAILIAFLLRFFAPDPRLKTGAVVVGLAVFSHYVCDWIVHGPDLPLFLGDGPKVGLRLWDHPIFSHALEIALFIFGLRIYLRSKITDKWPGKSGFIILSLVLVGVDTALPFFPPALGIKFSACLSLIFTLLIAHLAATLDQPCHGRKVGTD